MNALRGITTLRGITETYKMWLDIGDLIHANIRSRITPVMMTKQEYLEYENKQIPPFIPHHRLIYAWRFDLELSDFIHGRITREEFLFNIERLCVVANRECPKGRRVFTRRSDMEELDPRDFPETFIVEWYPTGTVIPPGTTVILTTGELTSPAAPPVVAQPTIGSLADMEPEEKSE